MGDYPIMLQINMFILVFFLFSLAGWCMEVTLKFIQYHRFINRGFLIGPYCPIYGWGAVTVTVLVGGLLAREGTYGETFLAGMVICGALEYFTSWYMEKAFHARWWDYSQKPMNLHGRIWIGNLLLFGGASVGIVKLIVPQLLGWFAVWPPLLVEILGQSVVVVMLADYVASHLLMNLVKKQIDSQEGDSTEEIARQVRALLKERGLLLRRIQSAYPEAQPRSRRLVAQWKAAKRSLKAAEQELKQARRNATLEAKERLQTLELHPGQSWKSRVEEAEASHRAARQRLRATEKKLFGRHEDE